MFLKWAQLNDVSQDAALGHKTILKRKVAITTKVRTVVTGTGSAQGLKWELAKGCFWNW